MNESIVSSKELEPEKLYDLIQIQKEDSRLHSQPRYAVRRMTTGNVNQDQLKYSNILQMKQDTLQSPSKVKLPPLINKKEIQVNRSGLVSPRMFSSVERSKQRLSRKKIKRNGLLPSLKFDRSISPEEQMNQSVQTQETNQKLPIYEEDYTEILKSKHLKVGEYQGFNVNLQYLKDRKKQQRKKDYWRLRVKSDFKPKIDADKVLASKLRLEEQHSRIISSNKFRRVPLQSLVSSSSRRKQSPLAASAITQSINLSLKSSIGARRLY